MSDEMMIRLAKPEDAGSLVSFNREMARETEDKDLAEDIVSAGVRGLLENPALGFYVVAVLGDGGGDGSGKVVGSLMVTMEWSDWRNGLFWWIQSVYIVPSQRRKGIYRRLYEFVKARAAEDVGVCGFRLYVEKENEVAQRTYEALGMEETCYKMYEELIEMDR